ncbi:hypothetical protein DFJ74DRAFT_694689 [Hyaloraphidium curvatum]|nr:hypothetical protein DFJ74DRAFT_694689 [Hyaloraphidium curvatum]
MDMYPSILFAKVDTDDFSEIAQGCEVEYTPTFQFYRGGEKFDEYVGSDAEQLRGQIALALASKSP